MWCTCKITSLLASHQRLVLWFVIMEWGEASWREASLRWWEQGTCLVNHTCLQQLGLPTDDPLGLFTPLGLTSTFVDNSLQPRIYLLSCFINQSFVTSQRTLVAQGHLTMADDFWSFCFLANKSCNVALLKSWMLNNDVKMAKWDFSISNRRSMTQWRTHAVTAAALAIDRTTHAGVKWAHALQFMLASAPCGRG